MRVALVAEDYYPQLGGVPEHVHHFALRLWAQGHEATIVTSRMRGAGHDAPFVHRVGTSVVIYANGGVARITVGWRLRHRLSTLFRAGQYDVVHVHGGLSPTLGLVAPVAAWDAGVPVVATFHTWFPRSVGYRVFRRPLQHMLDRHAAAVAVSSAAVAAMSRYFHADWTVIPNGIDTEAFHSNGRRTDAYAGAPRLLFLGRLEPRTGLGVVLDALPSILAQFPEARLTVAGDGPWRGTYARHARPYGDRVQFLGSVFAKRPELYRSADLYLCPTTRASFGLTVLEAMASGTPIIASDLPAFRDLATDQAAMFVPPTEPRSWAQATIVALQNTARQRSMSEAGRRRALEFGWPAVTDRVVGVYERVLGRPALTPA